MPWKPFKKKVKHRRLKEDEEETSFDCELLPRSSSDGNLTRAPSERFLLQNLDHRRSYGTCSSGSSMWTSFRDHTVEEGETLAGLSLKYNITIQDIKLSNKIWTNDGIWTGRTLKIPIIEVSSTNLDLSGSSACTSETMSTDSQISGGLIQIDSSSSSSSSRRVSSSLDYPNSTKSFNSSPISLPLHRPVKNNQSQKLRDSSPSSKIHRASVEDLSSFLSAMDSSIEINKATSISMIKSSKLKPGPGELEDRSRGREGDTINFLTNNNGSISMARGGRAQDHVC